jgi:uncharacterized phiE125 gp8 family phage protein
LALEAAKLHLRVDANTEDALISALCTAVREDCENDTNRALVDGSFTLKLDAFPCFRIVLPVGAANVANVAITYTDPNGATQTLAANTYAVLQRQDDFPAIVPVYGTSFPSVRCQPDAVTVTFNVTASVPESLKASMKLHLGYLFENREPTKQETFAIDALRSAYRLVWV